jgi:hypothetical protein
MSDATFPLMGELATSAARRVWPSAPIARSAPACASAGQAASPSRSSIFPPTVFRASTHLDLQKGADVWLKLPGLEALHARVAWMEGYLVGCKVRATAASGGAPDDGPQVTPQKRNANATTRLKSAISPSREAFAR